MSNSNTRDNKQIRVSIITVTYNSGKTLSKAVESVLNQSVSPFEYIIVDGASTDDTLAIAHKYDEEFAKKGIIFTIISEPDKGIYDAMNKGIAKASGDIVGMINSDDYYEPCAVETVVDSYLEAPFDLFYADLNMVRPDGTSFVKHSRDRKYATSRDWNHPTTFITKEIYNNYSYKNDTIHDDYDLILRLKKAGVRVRVVNKVIANFVMNGVSHDKSISKAISRMKIKYGIYRDNGYSPLYFIECFMVEVAKLILG